MLLPQRFWDKVDKTDSCWEWIACLDSKGYGRFKLNGKSQRSHRLSYENTKGIIPKELDHLCRNRKCVNPNHLEAVTRKENCRRGLVGFVAELKQRIKTRCPQGHPYSKENTYIRSKSNYRECKICVRSRILQYQHNKKLSPIQP